MAEEQGTLAPSARRRQEARQLGLVARSPDLAAAVGLLAAVALLGAFGDDLVRALVGAVREPLESGPLTVADPVAVVAALRRLALAVGPPLAVIVGGSALAIVAAHQVQVGGLWLPGRLAPDPARLWPFGNDLGAGLLARVGRGAWSLAKAVTVVVVAGWSIRSELPALDRLAALESAALARAAGSLLVGVAYALALATVALGVLDFALQFARVEARLRMTPEEQKEEQKALDGDPAIRARRLRVARERLRPAGDPTAGAALVLTGAAGLTVVLGGGPPPGRPLTVRAVARGPAGMTLRRAARRAGLPQAESAPLARHLARGAVAGRTLPPERAAELAALWPATRP